METIYKERANGRWEYWVYSDGNRVCVSCIWVMKEVRLGRAKIVNV